MLRALVLRWSAHGVARAYRTVILHFHWFELKKLVSAGDAPSALLLGEDK